MSKMTVTYNPDEIERLCETVRRIASIKRAPCPDCSCWSCADCHCSLEHARRDREIAMADQLEAARAEIDRLAERQQAHLQLVAKLARETPYPAELDECRSARAKLIAEVGTLRARIAELESTIASMAPVVAAAEVQRDRNDDDTDGVFSAVDAYRAGKP